jgi:hypothetical protein
VPRLKIEVRQILQRLLYRKDKYFGGDGRGEIILLLRCLLESSGNKDAIGKPLIVSAVAGCLEPKFIDRGVALIEAFDQIPMTTILNTMWGLDLFRESSLGLYYGIVLRNKLAAILEPLVSKPAPGRAKRVKRTEQPKRRSPIGRRRGWWRSTRDDQEHRPCLGHSGGHYLVRVLWNPKNPLKFHRYIKKLQTNQMLKFVRGCCRWVTEFPVESDILPARI